MLYQTSESGAKEVILTKAIEQKEDEIDDSESVYIPVTKMSRLS
jgi:hypothetical protein